MYADHPPVPDAPVKKVIVIEKNDKDIDAVIKEARAVGATTKHDGEEFWIVFAEDPRRMWDFTERSLRSTLKRRLA